MYHYWIKVFSPAEQAQSLPSANRNCQSKDLFLINARRYFILISTFFEKHWCSLKAKAGSLCLCLRLLLPAPHSSLVVRHSVNSVSSTLLHFFSSLPSLEADEVGRERIYQQLNCLTFVLQSPCQCDCGHLYPLDGHLHAYFSASTLVWWMQTTLKYSSMLFQIEKEKVVLLCRE